jgi:hypothetical protein
MLNNRNAFAVVPDANFVVFPLKGTKLLKNNKSVHSPINLHFNRVHGRIALFIIGRVDNYFIEDFEQAGHIRDFAFVDFALGCIVHPHFLNKIIISKDATKQTTGSVRSTLPMYVSGRSKICSNCDFF